MSVWVTYPRKGEFFLSRSIIMKTEIFYKEREVVDMKAPLGIVPLCLAVMLLIVSLHPAQAASVVYADDAGNWTSNYGSVDEAVAIVLVTLVQCSKGSVGECTPIATCDGGGWAAIAKGKKGIAAACAQENEYEAKLIALSRCKKITKKCSIEQTFYDPN